MVLHWIGLIAAWVGCALGVDERAVHVESCALGTGSVSRRHYRPCPVCNATHEDGGNFQHIHNQEFVLAERSILPSQVRAHMRVNSAYMHVCMESVPVLCRGLWGLRGCLC